MKRLIGALAALFLLAPAATAAAATITFTEFGVSNGTEVTTQYQLLGIVGSQFYQYEDGRDLFDNFGIAGIGNQSVITFTALASTISIDYVALAGSGFELSALDAGLNILQSLIVTAPASDINASFAFGASGVKYLALTGPGRSIGISTLRFDAATVPEPATWAIMITGMGATGLMLRRRRTLVVA